MRKLVFKWKDDGGPGRQFRADYESIRLNCHHCLGVASNIWQGHAQVYYIGRAGPNRKSIKAAQQDAERIAGEILLDIRDGARAIAAKYGVEND